MRLAVLILIAGFVMILGAGCVSAQVRADIGANAQAISNAAASLPVSPQTTAIILNAAAIGVAVDHLVTPPTH